MGQLIPDRVLQEIAYRNDIADVVGARVTLHRAGASLKGLCPFHKEKTPSFHVNAQRQTFRCFGCGAHGDVFRFLMQMDGMDFPTAVRTLADRAGIEIAFEDDGAPQQHRKLLYRLHSELAAKYHSTLFRSENAARAREYLASRDLSRETADAFMIGYAPNAWDTVLKWAQKEGYKPDVLVETGILVEKRGESGETARYYDRFRHRLMFPILDPQGRTIAFSGRIIDAEEGSAKYVNSPETPIFQKGRVLYAMDKARMHIAKAREAVICEGQIDVIRCHQAGFQNAVAAQGTAFTEEHVGLVKRCADSVILTFDSDSAGQTAGMKTARLFIAAGLAVRVAVLPKGEDPDSFIRRNGADAFRGILEQAQSAIAFQVAVLSQRENTATEAGAMRVAREVLRTVQASPNPLQRAKLVAEAAERLGVARSVLDEELQQIAWREPPRAKRPTAPAAPDSPRPAAAREPEATEPAAQEEVMLCEHLVQASGEPELAELAARYLPPDMVRDPKCRATVQLAVEAMKAGVAVLELAEEADAATPGLAAFVQKLQATPTRMHGREYHRSDAVKELILVLWRRRLTAERDALTPEQTERSIQLTYDLKSLRTWGAGHTIIEIEMGV